MRHWGMDAGSRRDGPQCVSCPPNARSRATPPPPQSRDGSPAKMRLHRLPLRPHCRRRHHNHRQRLRALQPGGRHHWADSHSLPPKCSLRRALLLSAISQENPLQVNASPAVGALAGLSFAWELDQERSGQANSTDGQILPAKVAKRGNQSQQRKCFKLMESGLMYWFLWGCFGVYVFYFELVDLIGIEPMTSSMPWKRAPSCATGPLTGYLYCRRWRGHSSITWPSGGSGHAAGSDCDIPCL